MFLKSWNFHEPLVVCTTLAGDYRVTSSLTNIMYCHGFVYKRFDQLAEKMSDSDEGFDILMDIKAYNLESLASWIGVYLFVLV